MVLKYFLPIYLIVFFLLVLVWRTIIVWKKTGQNAYVMNVLGFFLILPNAITLLVLVLDTALIQIQISLEEDHFKKLHGSRYEDSCRQVRRWF